MPANGWRHMLCVEAAVTQPVILPAGEEWYGRQTLAII
jgi:glucose-6-phosphate 1-epimerase